MRCWLILLLLCAAGARAGQSVQFCYNYGCLVEDWVHYDDAQLAAVRNRLRAAADAAAERERLALVLGMLYRWAGEQLPIRADKGGDYADGAADGSMDCIDHATTTARLLRMIEAHGWLRHHRVVEQARRSFLIMQHYSAVIEERVPPVAARKAENERDHCESCYSEGGSMLAGSRPRETPPGRDPRLDARWAVDTWFRDNGAPAAVMPLDTWLSGAYPDD